MRAVFIRHYLSDSYMDFSDFGVKRCVYIRSSVHTFLKINIYKCASNIQYREAILHSITTICSYINIQTYAVDDNTYQTMRYINGVHTWECDFVNINYNSVLLIAVLPNRF